MLGATPTDTPSETAGAMVLAARLLGLRRGLYVGRLARGVSTGRGHAVMTPALTPLISLLFAGRTLTEHDDLRPGEARIGCPVWGPAQLLGNLELQLGLPRPARSEAVRVQRWSRRMAALEAARPGRFYARSYALDSLGTATTLLAWRDDLVLAGWNEGAIPSGGERLDTLAELATGSDLPPGKADRLCRVEKELGLCGERLLDAVLLAEARALWPGRWQRVFALLEGAGARVGTVDASFEPATGDSDLARLQALLRAGGKAPSGLRGDGSIVVLRAETSWELGDAAAALLRAWDDPSTAIVRSGEARPLDHALTAQGLASQGLDETSAWRPALQLLPLAVEMAFEPRDPYRVLELLTLSVGPFQGIVGRELASALAEAPGIGGPAWREAKEEIANVTRTKSIREAESSGVAPAEAARLAEERVLARLARIATWLEEPGHDGTKGAPRGALLAVADRVRTWLRQRLAATQKTADSEVEDSGLAARVGILGTAFAQAQAFHEALSHESRETLDLVDARLLVEQVSSGHTLALTIERAGRIDAVDSPAALRRARDVVVWWHCVSGTEWRPSARPWRRAEESAMRDAGILLPDPAERLTAEARSWHQVVLAARKRLVLAMPRWACGEPLDPHPVWHEIAARLGATTADLARVTLDARDLLAGRVSALGGAVLPAVMDFGSLTLPPAPSEWRLDPTHLGASAKHSASSLEALVGCPLQWVLKYAGDLRTGALDSIASGPLLYGKLGHRLFEEVNRSGGLAKPGALQEGIQSSLDRLLREEAAVLLRPGMTFELAQLRDQLAHGVTQLAEVLAESKLTVVGVEVAIDAPWRTRVLRGRLDLLLRDETGRDVVLDLKWGRSRYHELLETGRATQLAVYARARQAATKAKEMPAAAYFSLSRGVLLATRGAPFARFTPIDGPSLADTWTKLERTADLVEQTLLAGRVPVTGVRGSLPLIEGLGIDREEGKRHLTTEKEGACTYCAYGALCGKNWEGMA